ncbi:glycosyltransferase family 2 protein [Candidatus Micrarchaeota archaeon]|nr:glycosyltransferase family 2 protein [Candidatus Micrarchaeota archaeon]
MEKLVSVVIPARNEAQNLPMVLREVRNGISKWRGAAEIIVVDDGSTDDTAAVASRLGARVVSNNSGVHGKGSALQAGFAASSGRFIVMMDADYSHNALDIPAMVAPLEKGDAGMVIGSRSLGGSAEYTLTRTVGNVLITSLFNTFFRTSFTDAINGFKAFRRELVAGRRYSASGFEIEVELVANAVKAGMKIGEIPSHERARRAGRMKSRTVRDGIRFFLQVLKEGLAFRLGM